MEITKESLAAHNAQRENVGNDSYRKDHKLGIAAERLRLQAIAHSTFGITGGHRSLTKRQVERHDFTDKIV